MNPRTPTGQGPKPYLELINEFEKFCMVDLGLADLTVKGHKQKINRFLKFVDKPVDKIVIDDVRTYLMSYKEKAPKTYRNQLCSLKVFFRDFLKRGSVVESFKFPFVPLQLNNNLPSKEQLQKFYRGLPSVKEKAVFLFLVSSGLRINEALELQLRNINFETRMITPNNHRGKTKQSWITFYNEESEQILKEYMKSRDKDSNSLFNVTKRRIQDIFKKISDEIGIRVTAQILRQWFCSEMGRLSVPDRYVDAFCGRTPKSILARHYTDYNPERLKRIYDKSNLKVLS